MSIYDIGEKKLSDERGPHGQAIAYIEVSNQFLEEIFQLFQIGNELHGCVLITKYFGNQNANKVVFATQDEIFLFKRDDKFIADLEAAPLEKRKISSAPLMPIGLHAIPPMYDFAAMP